MLVRLDSFDHYSTAQLEEKWSQIYAQNGGGGVSPTINPGSGRNGSYSLRCALNSLGATMPPALVVPACQTYIVGFRFQATGVGGWQSNFGGGSWYPWVGPGSLNPTGSSWLVAFRADNKSHITVATQNNGCLAFWKGQSVADPATVRLGYANFPLQWGRIYYLEFKVTIDSTAGYIEMRANGDTWFTFVGSTRNESVFDGPPPAASWIDEIVIGHNTQGNGIIGNAGATAWDYDDLYIANTIVSPKSGLVDFWGDHRLDYRNVIADGFYQEWEPATSGGDHFEEVNDNPHDSDGSYIEVTASGVGLRDSFDHEPAVVVGFPIDAMQVVYSAKRTQGGPSAMRPFIRSAGIDYVGDDRGNTTDYSFWLDIWEALTASGDLTDAFDATEIGVEKVS